MKPVGLHGVLEDEAIGNENCTSPSVARLGKKDSIRETLGLVPSSLLLHVPPSSYIFLLGWLITSYYFETSLFEVSYMDLAPILAKL